MRDPRQLPSGKWQGIAVHPSGRWETKTFRLKGQAREWAKELEAIWRRNASFDPRAGERPAREWLDAWEAARSVDPVTAAKETSQLRNHIRPQWEDWPLAAIRPLDVAAWVKQMQLEGVGAHTVVGVAVLFGMVMKAAVAQGLIITSPCVGVRLPNPPAKAPFYWTKPEAAAIVAEFEEPWRTAVELDLHVGLRLGELLGLQAGAVDWPRRQAHVVGVMTRYGWRQHPKSSKSQRTVPIPDWLLDPLRPLVVGRPAAAFVFPGRGGRPVSDVNFRNRLWGPALARAGLCPAHRPPAGTVPDEDPLGLRAAAVADCAACAPVPRGTPHDMRHTAASWLVIDGVDLYRVQDLLGHESFKTTQRYAHLEPNRHDRIREAWGRPQDPRARPVHEEPEPLPEDR